MTTLLAVLFCLSLSGVASAEVSRTPAPVTASEVLPGSARLLALPANYRPGATLFIQVQARLVPAGHALHIRGKNGELLGVVSPYGTRGGEAGIYTLPLAHALAQEAPAQGLLVYISLMGGASKPQVPNERQLRAVKLVQ